MAVAKPAPVGLNYVRWRALVGWFGGCAYCGVIKTTPLRYQIEHMVPRSRGGRDHIENVVPACADCNMDKGRMTGEEYVDARQVDGDAVNDRFAEWLRLTDRSFIWHRDNRARWSVRW